MNHSEIVRILSDRTGMTQKDVKQLMSGIVKSLGDVLGEYKGYSIPELGTFGTHVRDERKAYSIPDGRNMMIPPKRLVYFGPATDLKDEFKDTSAEMSKAPPVAKTEELSEHDKMRMEMMAEADSRAQIDTPTEESSEDQGPVDDQEETLS
ncbi:HU family DNA-binding protein [Candidatus Neomarinimicrobiota bacterium]